jgi:hypothetical protein
MTRRRAALLHLAISASLAAVVIALILFFWYPLPYFWAMGGPLLLVLILGVDVVLGPLMTLIVFNPAKPRRELRMDLGLIALIQAAALIYGLHAGFVTRLVYVVYSGHGFQIVKANELGIEGVAPAQREAYRDLPWWGPRYVAARLPTDPKGQSDLSYYRATGVGDWRVPAWYVPLDEMRGEMATAGIPQTRLARAAPALQADLQAKLRLMGLAWADVAVLPLSLPQATYTLVLHLADARVISVQPHSPYGD